MAKNYENQISDYQEEENQIQNVILLLLSTNDKDSVFSLSLSVGVVKTIINKLMESSPSTPRHFFTSQNRYRLNDFEKSINEYQKRKGQHVIEAQDRTSEEEDSTSYESSVHPYL